MSLINIVNMNVLENPTNFLSPIQFEITFECTSQLEADEEHVNNGQDIEWKVVYVGSAENSTHDQVLDEIIVGPVPVGINKFILETDAPDPSLIPANDVLGITVVLVTCSYRDQEFARVGYYVHNEYIPFEGYNEIEHGVPSSPIDMSKVFRTIMADKPRVTMFSIQWSGESNSQCESNCGDAIDCDMDDHAGISSSSLPILQSPGKSQLLQQRPFVVSPDSASFSNRSTGAEFDFMME